MSVRYKDDDVISGDSDSYYVSMINILTTDIIITIHPISTIIPTNSPFSLSLSLSLIRTAKLLLDVPVESLVQSSPAPSPPMRRRS